MVLLAANYVRIKQDTDKLAGLYSSLQREIRIMQSSLRGLDIFWDGDANAEFHMVLNEDFALIAVLCINIRNAISLLDEAVSEYQKTEFIVNQMIGGIHV